MRKFRIFTTAAVLSLSLLTVSGCGNRDTSLNNTLDRRNVSTNDVGRTDRNVDLRTVGTDRDLRFNRDNDLRTVGTDRNNRMPATNARGYITTSPVAYTPSSGYIRLCPCPGQTTSNITRPGTTTTIPGTTTTIPGTTTTTPGTTTTTPGTTTTTPGTTTNTGTLDTVRARVVELTNAERRKNGLRDLQVDNSLSNVAQTKSNDMLSKNYFSHTSPTYGSPFDMMKHFGITYSYAGENIAQGQRSADEVVTAWMNSPGHRANILNANYTHIGVGHTSTKDYWTQEFIGK